MKPENTKTKSRMSKFQKEDILLAIETLQYNNNQKPTIADIADFLHTYRDNVAYYIKKYSLEGKCNITERGKYMREKNSDIFEEIARNTRNISKSLYVLALLNLMKYINENEVDITTDALYIDSREVLLTIGDEIINNIKIKNVLNNEG